MKKLSPEVIQEVKQLLYPLRKQTSKEIIQWGNHPPAKKFYSDDKVIEMLPFAAHEFWLMKCGIHINEPIIIQWLNAGVFSQSLPEVITYILRWLAVTKR